MLSTGREKTVVLSLLVGLAGGCGEGDVGEPMERPGHTPGGASSPDPPGPATEPGGATGPVTPPGTPPGAAQTPPGGANTPMAPRGCRLPAARLWKLSPDEYTRTVAAVLPGVPAAERPGDELVPTLPPRTNGLTNAADGLVMALPHVARLFKTTRRLVARALEKPALLAPCLGVMAPTATDRAARCARGASSR